MSVRSLAVVVLLPLLLTACAEESTGELSAEALQLLQQRSQAFQGRAAAGLLQDDSALALAGELYVAHCAACHGNTGAESERGVPQLENAMFHHGESEAAIRTTIREGRHSVMPSFGGEMSEVELGAVVA